MYIKQLFGTERPTLKDIERFVKSYKEDSRLEFKESVSGDNDKLLLRPVVAFANSEGGVLLIGITDRERKIVGVEIENEKLNEDLEHLILSRIEPSLAGLFVIVSVNTPEGRPVKDGSILLNIKCSKSSFNFSVFTLFIFCPTHSTLNLSELVCDLHYLYIF